MKNILDTSNGIATLLSNVDDGTNSIYINGAMIPVADWTGTGDYTFTDSGVTFTIHKISDASGNIMLQLVSGTTYTLLKCLDSDSFGSGVYFGTCTTAAATAAKEVTLTNTNAIELKAGIIIGVKFSNSNTASNVTLNVNGTGAKSIFYNTTVYTGYDTGICGRAGRTSYYMYDGTYWVFLSQGLVDSNTYTSAYCSTAAETAAKTASCSGYNLLANSYIHIIMTTANTSAGALTLNINGKGAKPIYINGAASSASNYSLPAGSYLVYYNGTNYYFRTDGKVTSNGMVNTGNNSDYPMLNGGVTDIPASSTRTVDLNTYITPGNYVLGADANAPYVTNQPIPSGQTQYGFNLLVMKSKNNNSFYRQILIYYCITNAIYTRFTTDSGSTWSAWTSMIYDSTKVPLAGGTITGDLNYKSSDVDASKANNNVSSIKYLTSFNILDKASRILTRLEAIVQPDGKIGAYLYARNYDTSGTSIAQRGIKIFIDKNGVATYEISNNANFRKAINAAANFQLTNEDLDNVKEPGFYNAAGDNTCIHTPFNTGTAFGLQVMKTAGGDYYTQLINANGSTTFYRRICGVTGWLGWVLERYTWRPIENSLTSDSTTDSLSAAQGKALANGSARDSTKLPLSGGTVTGNIVLKRTDIDASKTNNNVSSTQYPTTFCITDTSNRNLARVEGTIASDGRISSSWYVRNYNTSGNQVGQNAITMHMAKDGTGSYYVSHPVAFRNAIGTINKAGDTMTGKLTITRSDGLSDGLLVDEKNGTTSEAGLSQIVLGNSKNATTAGNSYGSIAFFSRSTQFIGLKAQDVSSIRNLYLPASGTAFATAISSSARIKENIRDLTEEEALKILDVNVVKFDYKEEYEDGKLDQSGVIAEEVIEIIPEVVTVHPTYDENKAIDPASNPSPTVDYGKFAPYLIKMVQMQQQKIEELEQRLAALES